MNLSCSQAADQAGSQGDCTEEHFGGFWLERCRAEPFERESMCSRDIDRFITLTGGLTHALLVVTES